MGLRVACKWCWIEYRQFGDVVGEACVYDFNEGHIYNTVTKQNLCKQRAFWPSQ